MPRRFDLDSTDREDWISNRAKWAIVTVPGAGVHVGLFLDERMLTVDGYIEEVNAPHVVRYVTQNEAEDASRKS